MDASVERWPDLHSPDPKARKKAVFRIGDFSPAEAPGLLAIVLEDDDAGVRFAAALELGRLDSDEAVEPLARALNDPDEQVRAMAVRSLGRLGRESAVPPLTELARTESTVSAVRGALADALKRLGAAEEEPRERGFRWYVSHPYFLYGVGLAAFCAGIWLAQARDSVAAGVIVVVAGIALLLVARVQVIRHSHDRQLWVYPIDGDGGAPGVWIASGAAGDGAWGDLGGFDGGGGDGGGGG